MTGNQATWPRVKRLRGLLDERGIVHYDHEDGEPPRVPEKAEEPATSWHVDGASYCAVPDCTGTFDIWIFHCTLEQAIAATLGSEREKALEELVRDWQVLAEARLDDEIALLKRIAELEELVRDMLFAIRLGSMSDLTDRDVLKSWFRDFSERASDLGLMEVAE